MIWEYFVSYNATVGNNSWYWGCGSFKIPHVLDSWEKICDLSVFIKDHLNTTSTTPPTSAIVIINFQLIKIHEEAK